VYQGPREHAGAGVRNWAACPALLRIPGALGRSSEAIERAQFALRLTLFHPPDFSAISKI
jgi:hypothetical protein